MTILAQFAESLSDETRIAIIKNNEKFEADGFIGECTLRIETRKFMNLYGIDSGVGGITLWMDRLVTEIYRIYAYRYLELMK